MSDLRHSLVAAYGLAVLGVIVAIFVRLGLDPWLGFAFPFATIFFAVLVAAWFGGFGPALVATVAGVLGSAWFLMPPRGSFLVSNPADQAGMIVYFGVGLGIGSLGGLMRQSRIRAEAAAASAARQREELKTTLESIGDAVAVTDARGVVTTFNAVAEALTGWPAADARGRPLHEVFRIVNEQTRKTVENPVARVLREGIVVGLANHTVLIARDGTERPIDDSAAPIRNAAGEMAGVVLVFRDVSERKRADDALRRLAAIVESSDDAIIGKDLDGVITSWNRGAERLYGYPAAEVIGKSFDVLVPPDRANEARESVARIRAGGRVDHLETMRRRRDGSLVEVSVSYSPIHDSEGHVVGTSVIARDFTQQKLAQDENARLYQSLREADRRKDEFLALLGHELRNPLAPISNALHIMKMPGADSAVAGRAREMMERQVEHMVRLVDDLLDVSRILRGKIELRREPLDLSLVVARAVETSQPFIDAEGHCLTVANCPEPLPVYGDIVRLSQVVSNLLNNAAKYSERGGRIELSIGREDGQAVLRVRDAGVGIPPELVPKLFDMFFQGSRRTRKSQGGLGIGLSLVRGLVEMHGGRVEARSDGPGSGSEFTVRLPLLRAEGGGRRADTKDDSAFRVPNSALQKKVLVVDDNVDAADSLAVLLEMGGQQVAVAYDGATALEKAKADPPQVAILDLGMPGMDGFELARAFRADPSLKGSRLIAMTGWGQAEDRQRSKEAGFDDHLVKPADAEALRKLLEDEKGEPSGVSRRV